MYKRQTLLFAGDNSFRQCALQPTGRVVSIAASARATYAVLEDGRVQMCGNGVVIPTELAHEDNVAAIAASDSHVVLL